MNLKEPRSKIGELRGANRVAQDFSPAAGQRGYTFIEIAIVAAIIGILASAALPLVKLTMQRQREIELRRSLREIRTAIDKYHDAAAANPPQISPNDLDPDSENYPPTLQTLVNGVQPANDPKGTGSKLRFLRRIPYDPMTRSTEWGLRSTRDEPDTRSWGGTNVYDVYTKYEGKGLDGTSYRDW